MDNKYNKISLRIRIDRILFRFRIYREYWFRTRFLRYAINKRMPLKKAKADLLEKEKHVKEKFPIKEIYTYTKE